MEWWLVLALIFGAILFLLSIGIPVAFAFLFVIMAGVYILQGGGLVYHTLVVSMYSSASKFALLPVPLFILMGEILWHSKVAFRAIDVLDKLLGRLPGRLSVLTVMSGTAFSALSGSAMATTAVLGTLLLPDMDRRGYKRPMSIGPILGSGGLAMIIPPSAIAVILATIAQLSIGRILVAALIPGLLMATLYLAYILIRCRIQPDLAPAYEPDPTTWRERIIGIICYLLPLGVIVFLVTGVIVVGIATPSEAAALGCFGSFFLAAAYRMLTWEVIVKALEGTLHITVMALSIIVGALAFSQLLAYSGASNGLVTWVLELDVPPFMLVIAMQVIVLLLGTFMELIAIMLMTLPLFIPIIKSLGFDPIWFAVMMLINLQMAQTTPPFGLMLFVMKGVAPPDVTMRQIYLAAAPFLMCDFVAITLIFVFPDIVAWLPRLAFDTG